MPIHDWTRVEASTFHDFHLAWITHLSEALNVGILPPWYYATLVLEPSFKRRRRTLTIRHSSGHRIIALIEILSPANKASPSNIAEFVRKGEEALRAGIHLVLIDLFSPGRHDSAGMHGALMESFSGEEYELPNGKPLTLASYAAEATPVAYLEHLAVGDPLPEMPLFLSVERYVPLPLEPTCAAAFRGMPAFWREVLERRRPDEGTP